MPTAAAASTSSGGTGAPPQPKQRRDSTRALATGGRLGQVLEERGRRQRVRPLLPDDEIHGRLAVPAVLQHEGQAVVEGEAHAVVESGRMADRRGHPDDIAGAEAEIVVGHPDAEVGRLLGVHDRLRTGLGARGEDQLRDGVGPPRAEGGAAQGKERRERLCARPADTDARISIVFHDHVVNLGTRGLHHLVDQTTVVESPVGAGREDDGRMGRGEHIGQLPGPVVRKQRVDHCPE